MNSDRVLTQGEYSTSAVATAAGVAKSVIADWIAREIISDQGASGRGHVRTYSLWNVVEAIIAARLNRAGLRSGTIASIMSVLEFEAHVLNTATKRKGGLEDFVLVVRVDPDGQPNSMYRESDKHRRPDWRDEEGTVLSFRIDVTLAIRQAEDALR